MCVSVFVFVWKVILLTIIRPNICYAIIVEKDAVPLVDRSVKGSTERINYGKLCGKWYTFFAFSSLSVAPNECVADLFEHLIQLFRTKPNERLQLRNVNCIGMLKIKKHSKRSAWRLILRCRLFVKKTTTLTLTVHSASLRVTFRVTCLDLLVESALHPK